MKLVNIIAATIISALPLQEAQTFPQIEKVAILGDKVSSSEYYNMLAIQQFINEQLNIKTTILYDEKRNVGKITHNNHTIAEIYNYNLDIKYFDPNHEIKSRLYAKLDEVNP